MQESQEDLTKQWLKWLARQLQEKSSDDFLIENLQPNSIQSRKVRLAYYLVSAISPIIILASTFIISSLLVFNPNDVWITTQNLSQKSWPVIGMYLVNFSLYNKIRLPERMRFSLKGFAIESFKSLLGCGIFAYSVGLLWKSPFFLVFLRDPVLILFAAILLGLIKSLQWSQVSTRRLPNQGILLSVYRFMWLFFGTVFIVSPILAFIFMSYLPIYSQILGGLWIPKEFLNFEVVFKPLLPTVTCIGLGVGLLYGGFAVIQHSLLRVVLFFQRRTPWNYTRFLNHCTERLLLPGLIHVDGRKSILEKQSTRLRRCHRCSRPYKAFQTTAVLEANAIHSGSCWCLS
jgi:hypothetical protein